MTFVQRILPAGDDRCDTNHGACSVIDCITTEDVIDRESGALVHPAGSVVWHSHMDADVHPEHRLNPHHPAEDHRGNKPIQVTATGICDACAAHPSAQGRFRI